MAVTTLPRAVTRARVTWIVCLRATREVDERGMVECPLAGIVPLRECTLCRFLEDREADRLGLPCSADAEV
jgi:hypothetical protein